LATLLRRPALEAFIEPELHDANYAPTPLFVQFYVAASTEPARGHHAGYLYEAASSAHGLDSMSHMVILAPNQRPDGTTQEHLLEISETFGGSNGDTPRHVSIPLTVAENEPVVFSRFLRSAHLEVAGPLVLGYEGNEFELHDVEIGCRRLELRANALAVRCPEATATIVVAERFVQVSPVLRSDVKGGGTFGVSWPGCETHPWIHYNVDATLAEAVDRESGLLAVRKILTWFRRDKKEDSEARLSPFETNPR